MGLITKPSPDFQESIHPWDPYDVLRPVPTDELPIATRNWAIDFFYEVITRLLGNELNGLYANDMYLEGLIEDLQIEIDNVRILIPGDLWKLDTLWNDFEVKQGTNLLSRKEEHDTLWIDLEKPLPEAPSRIEQIDSMWIYNYTMLDPHLREFFGPDIYNPDVGPAKTLQELITMISSVSGSIPDLQPILDRLSDLEYNLYEVVWPAIYAPVLGLLNRVNGLADALGEIDNRLEELEKTVADLIDRGIPSDGVTRQEFEEYKVKMNELLCKILGYTGATIPADSKLSEEAILTSVAERADKIRDAITERLAERSQDYLDAYNGIDVNAEIEETINNIRLGVEGPWADVTNVIEQAIKGIEQGVFISAPIDIDLDTPDEIVQATSATVQLTQKHLNWLNARDIEYSFEGEGFYQVPAEYLNDLAAVEEFPPTGDYIENVAENFQCPVSLGA